MSMTSMCGLDFNKMAGIFFAGALVYIDAGSLAAAHQEVT